MKTQQRKFVVEIKSARRRSTTRPDSIWNDTDLKALVREVEADAPHLFEPHIFSKTVGQDSELQPNSNPETSLNDNVEVADDRPISMPSIEAERIYFSQQGNDLAFNSVPQLNEDASKWRSPKVARRRREARLNHTDFTSDGLGARSTAAPVEAPSDELVALDEENRRLKGLLAKHLLQQNGQLRKMLARFGVI